MRTSAVVTLHAVTRREHDCDRRLDHEAKNPQRVALTSTPQMLRHPNASAQVQAAGRAPVRLQPQLQSAGQGRPGRSLYLTFAASAARRAFATHISRVYLSSSSRGCPLRGRARLRDCVAFERLLSHAHVNATEVFEVALTVLAACPRCSWFRDSARALHMHGVESETSCSCRLGDNDLWTGDETQH